MVKKFILLVSYQVLTKNIFKKNKLLDAIL